MEEPKTIPYSNGGNIGFVTDAYSAFAHPADLKDAGMGILAELQLDQDQEHEHEQEQEQEQATLRRH